MLRSSIVQHYRSGWALALLRRCPTIVHQHARAFGSGGTEGHAPELVDLTHAPPEIVADAASFGLTVLPNVITVEQHDELVAFLQPRLRRSRYEKGHWDGVITQYREHQIDHATLPASCRRTILTVFRRLFSNPIEPLQQQQQQQHDQSTDSDSLEWQRLQRTLLPLHVLDLAENGYIKAHVDNIKFSGELLSGLSLLSESIMRLTPATNDTDPTPSPPPSPHYIDLLLLPRSLYDPMPPAG